MKKIIISAICVLALATSCKKETVEGPQGPAGTNGTNGTNGSGTTGTIIGKIKQYDQFGTPYTTALNTVTLNVENTTNSATTDAAGNFTISNLAPGVYDIDILKPNCGLRKYQQITFPGNGTLYIDDNISDKATYTFANGYLKDTVIGSTHTLKVNIGLGAPIPKSKNIIIFYSSTNNIDPTNPATYDAYQTIFVGGNISSYTGNNAYGNATFNPFQSGSTFYAKVYPNTYTSFSYYDYTVGKQMFTGVGTPLPTTFTLTMP